MTKKASRNIFIFICLFPATALILLLIYYPTIDVFKNSLFNKRGFIDTGDFVGLQNFQILFKDKIFIESLQNTILYVVIVTLITISLALIFASLFVRENFKFKSLFGTIFYIPNILSMVVIAGIFSAIYQPSNGLLNSFLGSIGLENLQRQWLGNPDIVNYSIIAVLIWQAIGYYMVMYEASMDSVPEQLYEAASLEGASKIHQFFNITLPLVWINIRTTLTFFITSTINLSFMFVQLTTDGGLGSESILNYMFKKGPQQYSYSMAISVCAFIVTFIIASSLNKATDREVQQY